MRSTLLPALSLFALAHAASPFSAVQSCLTEYGSSKADHVRTTVSTVTVSTEVTVQATVHSTETVTPSAVTETDTVTSTTYLSSSVPTSTVDITSWSQVLVTQTVTRTATVSNVSVITTTIATPAGFLPIADTTASTYPGSGGYSNATVSSNSSTTSQKGKTRTVSLSASASAGGSANVARNNKQSFPKVVSCIESVLHAATKTHQVTGHAKTTTLKGSTHTHTITDVVTSTLKPTHLHGKTFVTTETIVATFTKTIHSTAYTTTSVAAVSTSSVYAACATNNQLGPLAASGQTIIGITSKGSKTVNTKMPKVVKAASAEACCAQCMQLDDCAATGYQHSLGLCYIYLASGAQSANPLNYLTYANAPQSVGWVVGNGPHGYLFSGGKASSNN